VERIFVERGVYGGLLYILGIYTVSKRPNRHKFFVMFFQPFMMSHFIDKYAIIFYWHSFR